METLKTQIKTHFSFANSGTSVVDILFGWLCSSNLENKISQLGKM